MALERPEAGAGREFFPKIKFLWHCECPLLYLQLPDLVPATDSPQPLSLVRSLRPPDDGALVWDLDFLIFCSCSSKAQARLPSWLGAVHLSTLPVHSFMNLKPPHALVLSRDRKRKKIWPWRLRFLAADLLRVAQARKGESRLKKNFFKST